MKLISLLLLATIATLTTATPVNLPHDKFSIDFIYGPRVENTVMPENTCRTKYDMFKTTWPEFDWEYITALRKHDNVNFHCEFFAGDDCKGNPRGAIYGIGPTEDFKAGSMLGLPRGFRARSCRCFIVRPPEQVSRRAVDGEGSVVV